MRYLWVNGFAGSRPPPVPVRYRVQPAGECAAEHCGRLPHRGSL